MKKQTVLFDEDGQLSPLGADNMLEQIEKTVSTVLKALRETKVKPHRQKIFVTLHPFDHIRFTNMGAVLFLILLMLILLGSNKTNDAHSMLVMHLLKQGVTMNKEVKVERGKQKKGNR